MRSQRDIFRRHKKCRFCHVDFCDIRKRPDSGVCCCKEHAIALSVQTRHSHGPYNSVEQNLKRVETIRRKYGSFSACQSNESRKKNSDRLKHRWASGSMQEKTKVTSIRKYSVEHWSKSKEGREFASKLHAGRTYSHEVRERMSASAANRVRTKRETLYTSGKGGYREDLKCYFRSNWEANYARILQFEGKIWKYEPQSIRINDVISYTPDFVIDGEEGFVEIKGRTNDAEAMKKVLAFMKVHPNIPIKLIGPKEYDELRKRFKHLIAWEGK